MLVINPTLADRARAEQHADRYDTEVKLLHREARRRDLQHHLEHGLVTLNPVRQAIHVTVTTWRLGRLERQLNSDWNQLRYRAFPLLTREVLRYRRLREAAS